jgi:hypothetical protein
VACFTGEDRSQPCYGGQLMPDASGVLLGDIGVVLWQDVLAVWQKKVIRAEEQPARIPRESRE